MPSISFILMDTTSRRFLLEERKTILAALLATPGIPANIRFSEHVKGNGPAFLHQACKMQLEGIVSKQGGCRYLPGRKLDWVKVKCVQKDEFVIGCYTDPKGARIGFGGLHLGYYDQAGDLIYAGRVGSGFDDETLKSLFDRLVRLQRDTSPFKNLKRADRDVHWVKP
jgi:bifunctional non-homologous end joining protein LigD